MNTPNLIPSTKAAEYLGISNKTLSKWRYTGEHQIPFVKMGRYVKYRISDLDAFIESRTMTQTA